MFLAFFVVEKRTNRKERKEHKEMENEDLVISWTAWCKPAVPWPDIDPMGMLRHPQEPRAPEKTLGLC